MTEKFYVCDCFFSRNIFLHDYNVHVTYTNKEQFIKDCMVNLQARGCNTKDKQDKVIRDIEEELKRRHNLGGESLQRTRIISSSYKPLYPHLYTLKECYFDSTFLEIWRYCRSSGATSEGVIKLIKKETERVYSLPVFTSEFCQAFLEEILYFEKSDFPKGRPNTMNNYGVLLNELGFDKDFLDPLRLRYLSPITKLLYPECGGGALDSHKAFIVQYKVSEDKDLSYHYDNAEVTLNVSLGRDFVDGQLYFGQMRDVPLRETQCTLICHNVRHGLLHRGQHNHGALAIQSGERYNLIIWMRSSRIRNMLCPMCDKYPILVENSGFGDGFTNIRNETEINACSTV